MKQFRVTMFAQGRLVWQGTVPASTHKAALKAASNKSYDHAVVLGEKVARRYNRKFKPMNGGIRLFKSYVTARPAILLMIGRVSELYRFEDESKRDEVYLQLCTPSTPAESVKANEEPTGITASSAETKGSRNGLTSKKIWNGSVTSATWQDLLTQFSIEGTSGKGNADAMAKPVWSDGSKASPSKQNRTFLATVLNTGEGDDSFTPIMKDKIGNTIKVTKVKDSLYKGGGWFWKKEWLDLNNVYVTVKPPIMKTTDGVGFTPSMEMLVGKTLHMNLCPGSSPAHYNYDSTWCFAQAWLEPAHKQVVEQQLNAVEENKMQFVNDKLQKVVDEIATEKKVILEPEKTWKEYLTKLNPEIKKSTITLEDAAKKWATLPAAVDWAVVDDKKVSAEDELLKFKYTNYNIGVFKPSKKNPFNSGSS